MYLCIVGFCDPIQGPVQLHDSNHRTSQTIGSAGPPQPTNEVFYCCHRVERSSACFSMPAVSHYGTNFRVSSPESTLPDERICEYLENIYIYIPDFLLSILNVNIRQIDQL